MLAITGLGYSKRSWVTKLCPRAILERFLLSAVAVARSKDVLSCLLQETTGATSHPFTETYLACV